MVPIHKCVWYPYITTFWYPNINVLRYPYINAFLYSHINALRYPCTNTFWYPKMSVLRYPCIICADQMGVEMMATTCSKERVGLSTGIVVRRC